MVHLGIVDVRSAVQERQVNRAVLFVIGAMLWTTGCESHPTASLMRIDTFDGNEAQLRRLYEQEHTPLVIVGHGVYRPPDECLCRKVTSPPAPTPAPAPENPDPSSETPPDSGSSPQDEGRKFGGLAEQRVIGGFAEQRVFGGGSIPIKCTARGDCKGFTVVIPLGGSVRYFDSRGLHDAPDNFVPIR